MKDILVKRGLESPKTRSLLTKSSKILFSSNQVQTLNHLRPRIKKLSRAKLALEKKKHKALKIGKKQLAYSSKITILFFLSRLMLSLNLKILSLSLSLSQICDTLFRLLTANRNFLLRTARMNNFSRLWSQPEKKKSREIKSTMLGDIQMVICIMKMYHLISTLKTNKWSKNSSTMS